MFINIITPCSRPDNLIKIFESINIPRENHRWIIVIDGEEPSVKPEFPKNAEVYWHKEPLSIVGNGQRNYALGKINSGYLYFLDDDTILHPDLWETVNNINSDFIHFDQGFVNGTKRIGGNIAVNAIDSGSVIIDSSIVKGLLWKIEVYAADGYYIRAASKRAKTPVYIPKILSVYNKLI
jgi:hypothetical protein